MEIYTLKYKRTINEMPIFILEFNLILFYHFKFKLNIKKKCSSYIFYILIQTENLHIRFSDIKRI